MKNAHRLTARLVASTAAAAAVPSLTATGARAATTDSPTGGPNVTFTGKNVSFSDIQIDKTVTCTQFDLSGEVLPAWVSLPTLVESGCTNPSLGQ